MLIILGNAGLMELKYSVGREQVFQAWESLEVDRRKQVAGLEMIFFFLLW